MSDCRDRGHQPRRSPGLWGVRRVSSQPREATSSHVSPCGQKQRRSVAKRRKTEEQWTSLLFFYMLFYPKPSNFLLVFCCLFISAGWIDVEEIQDCLHTIGVNVSPEDATRILLRFVIQVLFISLHSCSQIYKPFKNRQNLAFSHNPTVSPAKSFLFYLS